MTVRNRAGGEEHGPFTYRWPGGDDEAFSRSRWFRIVDGEHGRRALVAWTEREAWGRVRERAVVFGETGSSLYPWTEFVETDEGRSAAGISDPDHPRALLTIARPLGRSSPPRAAGRGGAPSAVRRGGDGN